MGTFLRRQEPTDWSSWRVHIAEEVIYAQEVHYGLWALYLGRLCARLLRTREAWAALTTYDAGRVLPAAPAGDVWADADLGMLAVASQESPPSSHSATRIRQQVKQAANLHRRGAPGGYMGLTGREAQVAWVAARDVLARTVEDTIEVIQTYPAMRPQHLAARIAWDAQRSQATRHIKQLRTEPLSRAEALTTRANLLAWVEMQGCSIDPSMRVGIDGDSAYGAEVTILSTTTQASDYLVRFDRPVASFGVLATDILDLGESTPAVSIASADTLRLPRASGGRAVVRPAAWIGLRDTLRLIPDVARLRDVPEDSTDMPSSVRATAEALTWLGGSVSDASRMQIRTVLPTWVESSTGIIAAISEAHGQLKRTWGTAIARVADIHRRLASHGYDRAAKLWLAGDIDGLLSIEDETAASHQGALGRASAQLQRMRLRGGV